LKNLLHDTIDNKNYKVGDIDFSNYKDDADISTFLNMKIVVPRSREASVYWDTKWCTARIDKREPDIFIYNMFSNYYKDVVDERLYILIFLIRDINFTLMATNL
jgi:hypothetical protein